MRRIFHDRSGNLGILGGITLFGLAAAAGLAVDFSSAARIRSQIQEAADAAALAVAAKDDVTVAEAAAIGSDTFLANAHFDAESFGASSTTSLETVEHEGRTTVVVTATAAVPTNLMKIAGIQSTAVSVVAQAERLKMTAEHCVYALDPVSQGAMTVNGSGSIQVPNCSIQVNSSHPNALVQQGGGGITAKAITVAGGFQSGKYTPTPLSQQEALADPLLAIVEPDIPNRCDYNDRDFANATLESGRVYCGNIRLAGNIRLQPGIHFFRGADVSLTSDANIVGTDVMLYLDRRTNIRKSTGTGQLSIAAPRSGPYRGIAIFGARQAASPIPVVSLYGNKDFNIAGTLYLPRHRLEITGSAELNVSSKSGWVIAWQFHYTGNSSMTLDAFGGPAPSQLASDTLRLVR